MTHALTLSLFALSACATATVVPQTRPNCHIYSDYEAQARAFETCLSHSAQHVGPQDCEALAARLAKREACFLGPLFDGPVIENFYGGEQEIEA